MSNWEPKKPYIYQPEPAFNKDGSRNERIYALAGPVDEYYRGKRFTKEEAEKELRAVLSKWRGGGE